ncbi:TPA: exosome complex protein Rrp42 [Candidatus Micrarchaeota archaeon]|nr:exosome complex protein Rrp42 [Candidatus Micrarchaeota archaeon]
MHGWLTMNEFTWEFMKDRVRKLAFKGLRLDRRGPLDYRPIDIQTGVYHHADGSAFVDLGGTKVAAGVKMEIGSPFPDTPDQGAIITDAELLPIANPTFEPGPPDENAIELARVVDRGIRESNAIDLSSLVIEEGKYVWLVFTDLRVLDDNGNLFDAASLAAVAALATARIPRVEYEGDEPRIVRGEYDGVLELNETPLLTTFVKIGNAIFSDPSLPEMKAADARISVATVDDGSITAIQKGAEGSFTRRELSLVLERAIDRGKYLREILKKVI